MLTPMKVSATWKIVNKMISTQPMIRLRKTRGYLESLEPLRELWAEVVAIIKPARTISTIAERNLNGISLRTSMIYYNLSLFGSMAHQLQTEVSNTPDQDRDEEDAELRLQRQIQLWEDAQTEYTMVRSHL